MNPVEGDDNGRSGEQDERGGEMAASSQGAVS
jgi:hypothetical protein